MDTLILALGHKARNGKGECVAAIYEAYKDKYDIALMSFASALREEVEAAAFDVWTQHYPGDDFQPHRAMELLCQWAGVEFDPDAKVEPSYPYGKQRRLYQYWGTEYRRSQDPNYWVKRMMNKIRDRKAQVVLIDDVRFPNELFMVKAMNGNTCKVTRLGFESGVPQHASETALDGYSFDFAIDCPDGELELLKQMAVMLFETLVERITITDDMVLDPQITPVFYTIKDAERDILEHALRNSV